jgi:hypothetical protein
MKKFLSLTAILEGLTGIMIIAIPKSIILFLLGKPADGPGGTITAMLAGAAIFSLGILCWLLRESASAYQAVKGMLVYNCAIIAVAVYGVVGFGLQGPGLWLIILAHSVLFIWGAVTLYARRQSPGS